MPVTLVTGKLGAGKTLVCVGKIRDAILDGRRVATNLDLSLEHLLPAKSRKVQVMRLPDKPTVFDLEQLGLGSEVMDESQNGLIVLDELGTWLNSRQWGDKSRQAVIDWLLHSRKKGWDVIFISQHANLIDKQVREAVIEFLVTCRRLDRLPVPFIGWLIRLVTGGFLSGRMPRIHVGIVRYGMATDSLVVERWIYRGVHLYRAFNTRQVFSDKYLDVDLGPGHGVVGTYSYLSPWHLVGRFRVPLLERIRRWWVGHERLQRRKRPPAGKLAPLVRLSPELRWRAARDLVARGVL